MTFPAEMLGSGPKELSGSTEDCLIYVSKRGIKKRI